MAWFINHLATYVRFATTVNTNILARTTFSDMFGCITPMWIEQTRD